MAKRTDIQWSVNRFNKFLSGFVKSTGVAAPLVLKKYATVALTRIVSRTPVDTGVARWGWSEAGLGLGVKVPQPNNQADAAQIDPGEYEENLSSTRPYIRFANNVSYILALEYGWSKQAPLGMVRLTMAELRSGDDMSADMMAELQDAWNETPGHARYRANKVIMSGMLGAVKDMPLTRKPKPTTTRRRAR